MASKITPKKNKVTGTKKKDKITWVSSKLWKKALTVNAGAGNDIINFKKSKYKNKLNGQAGNDTVYGGTKNDTIHGNAGADKLYGYNGADKIYGDDSNDKIYGGNGNDYLYGGKGNDYIDGGNNNDKIYGNYGTNTLKGGAGNDSIYGGTGIDKIYAGAGTDYVDGGAGNDIIWGNIGTNTLKGGAGNDIIYSGTGNDYIYADDGNDTIYSNGGINTINSNLGDNYIDVKNGTNTIVYDVLGPATLRTDTIVNFKDNDTIHFTQQGSYVQYEYSEADDALIIGSSRLKVKIQDYSMNYRDGYVKLGSNEPVKISDLMIGNFSLPDTYIYDNNDNTLQDTEVNGKIYTRGGNDTITNVKHYNKDLYIYTGAGNDSITGVGECTTVYGGDGDDFISADYIYRGTALHGGAGNDIIRVRNGQEQSASLFGDEGDDLLEGGQYMKGGDGNDTIVAYHHNQDGSHSARMGGDKGNDVLRRDNANTDHISYYYNLTYNNGDDTIEDNLSGESVITFEYTSDELETKFNESLRYLKNGNDLIIEFKTGESDEYGDNSITFKDFITSENQNNFKFNTMLSTFTVASSIAEKGFYGEERIGTDGNDTLNGTAGCDTINGNAGNDIIYGGKGDDAIDGGSDNDTIYAGSGYNTISGGTGDDEIHTYLTQKNEITDTEGNDVLIIENYEDTDTSGNKDNTHILFNVSATYDYDETDATTLYTGDVLLTNTATKINYDLWQANGSYTGISVRNNAIETINSADGYSLTNTDISTLAESVAGWLTTNGYANVAEVFSTADNTTDILALIAQFDNANWQAVS